MSVFPALIGAIAAVLVSCGHTATDPTTLEHCAGLVVTVHRDDPVGCDLRPPQRLTVTDVTATECAQMGGRSIPYVIPPLVLCTDVDY